VVIVIDQFRYDYLTRFQDLFDPVAGGFARFRTKGAFFANANYEHATTYTAPGHAHILSGSYAYLTGIVGNRWFDRASGKLLAATEDPDAHFVGAKGNESDGTSPRNFIGTTLGDELILNSQGRSKVVSIALKSRSAVLMGGKLGKAYWFNESSGGFETSSYYAKALPEWVVAWNKKRLADTYFGKAWTASVPESAFARASEDDFPQEGDIGGLGRTFPHKVNGKLDAPGEAYYDALSKTPFGNDVTLEFARAALEAEGLGRDDAPDILAVSLSSNDEVGHTFGPYSREVLDITARTDRQLGAFLRHLDQKVPGHTAVLTADHGANPIPEYIARLGIDAHRIKKRILKDAIEKALDEKFGDGDWVLALEDPSVYLNLKLAAERKLDATVLEDSTAEALTRVPGILRCYTRTQLLRGVGSVTAVDRSFQLVFYPPRSGDVLILMRPYSFWGSYYAEAGYGGSHGSPYSYDTHVPLALLGPGIVPGIYHEDVAVADLAPTLATLLQVNPPPAAEGRVLHRALKTR
jgi:predicted AlkP superfamily pyrophosphatase or phosphodiesterase